MWETTVQSTTIDVPKELVLDAMRFQPKAVIFDIDGTMVDNMALHAEAFAVFARRHGLPPLFEDAPMGIVAAQASGMPVVALSTRFDAAHLASLQPPPSATCADFHVFLEHHFS